MPDIPLLDKQLVIRDWLTEQIEHIERCIQEAAYPATRHFYTERAVVLREYQDGVRVQISQLRERDMHEAIARQEAKS